MSMHEALIADPANTQTSFTLHARYKIPADHNIHKTIDSSPGGLRMCI